MRDLPTVFWLLATVASTLVHPWVPAPRWLMIHLLLLGAITHAIVVWSSHFTDALLHLPTTAADVRTRSRRLVLLNLGVVLVVTGVLAGWWPVVVTGASAVAGAVLWHGVSLWERSRRALGARLRDVVAYYLAAALLLPVGATFGVLLARGTAEHWHDRLVVAHAGVNVLGWVGLTVTGTLVTLWPTILRTRIAPGAQRASVRALPVLLGGLAVIVLGALVATPPVVAVGVALYVAGLLLTAPAFVTAARAKPPASFAAWSVLAGVGWLLLCLVAVTVGFATTTRWSEAATVFSDITPLLAAGFAAQVLLGALSYLVPVALGGGPSPVRAANTVLDRAGALRIVLANGGLALCALPVPSVVRVLASMLVLAGLAAFLPLLVLAIRASRRSKQALTHVPAAERSAGRDRGPLGPVESDPQRTGLLLGQVATGLTAIVVAVAAGIAVDPIALATSGAGTSAAAGVAPTGHTTSVRVEAKDMRFTPGTIRVPAGDRLVIEVVNTDDGDVHDLLLESGDDSGRLRPGESATLDIGVVGRDLDGWCSVLGHRQMGMTLTIETTGGAAHDHGQPAGGHASGDGKDQGSEPDDGFVARDASLGAVPRARLQRHTFRVSELDREVAPGVTAHLWTFNGTAPGPLLHGKVGDTFEITLVNDGTIGHSIDFHAGTLAPDRPMRTIAPGESLVYRFTATKAGIWMYHCSTMPMSAHIANGLFGAVVIEPDDLPEVDRSYVLAQSELYLAGDGEPVDVDALAAESPDLVVFNGYANQYDTRPLTARVGERVRIWLLDAGPNRATSFHVVGGQFDTVWKEGGYRLRRGAGGAQSLDLQPAQGGFVELTFPEAGRYPFVSHVMVDAERGAHGVIEVTE